MSISAGRGGLQAVGCEIQNRTHLFGGESIKHLTISSIVYPSSRFSKTADAGIRIPWKTHAR